LIKSPKGVISHTLLDNNDGTYKVDYTPVDLGKHTISITLNTSNIIGSPFIVPVTRGGPDASKCKAYGPGLEPGNEVAENAHFTVECSNKIGDRIKEGGDKVEVKVKGPYNVEIPPEITDKKDGTYNVNYKPLDPGNHVISISINGVQIPQSPINVFIEKSPTDVDATQCIAYGPGVEKGFTSELSTFTVEVRNSSGERINHGGHPIDVDVSDANGSDLGVKIMDNKDGTYSVTYQSIEHGLHTVDVVLRHKLLPIYYEHIQSSPFKVQIGAGVDAHKCIAFGPGLEDKVTDQIPTYFTIQAKDTSNNNMNRGGDPFEIKIQGPNGPVDANITDNGDGTYLVNYAPKNPGKHKIDITLKKVPVAKSPYTVNVKEGADNDTSVIDGYSFVIQAKTRKGANRTTGTDDFKVSITGPTNVAVDLKDLGNGTYLVSYKLVQQGDYVINITLNGLPLKNYENGIRVSY